ncbi:MAG: TIGR02147 family protein [Deltaproteobacteria bacterium]|nr:TIGR02147 family protein [Deltaproteobacteria bacterium]
MKCSLPVYSYEDYRQLLKDYYLACKEAAPQKFSYRYWARRADFSSSNFISLVITGKRNLSPDAARRLARSMRLTPRQSKFFEELVRFGQTTDVDERVRALEALLAYREYCTARQLSQEQFEYFSRWYYPVVREMVALPDFQPDPAWIATRLHPAIRAPEAGRALAVLERLGLIQQHGPGRYIQTEKTLTTSREVCSLAVAAFHRDMIRLGQASMQTSARHREVSSLTMSLSSEEFRLIKRKIHTFHEEVLALLHHGVNGGPSHVYQLNFQLFPVVQGLNR